MASKRNPASGESLMLLLGAGIVGYFAYINNWLNINNWLTGLGLAYSTAVPAPASGSTAATVASGGATSTTAAAVAGAPSLGTPVSTIANAQLQAAANYPYIIPTGSLTSSSPPSGYQLLNTQDYGNIWATNAVVSAAQNYVAVANAACTAWVAAGNPVSTCPSRQPMTTTLLQTIISQAGLSGLGFVRGRSMYPFNPITSGVGILNAPRGWN
jgi:hypothetical protein